MLLMTRVAGVGAMLAFGGIIHAETVTAEFDLFCTENMSMIVESAPGDVYIVVCDVGIY